METLYNQIYCKAFQEGFQEGRQELKQELVWNAFEKGFQEDYISTFTGIPLKDIRKMQKAWFSTKKSNTTN